MLVIIRIGGSIIASPLNPSLIGQYLELLKKLRKSGHQIIAVVGGGILARELIKIGDDLGLDEEMQDWLAIHISRLYALLISFGLGDEGIGNVPTSIEGALAALKTRKIVVLGGLEPGMTTDAVAARLAKETKAKLLVKATDQDGIFSEDPREHKDARKLDRLTYRKLAKLFEQKSHKAGIRQILDPVALQILRKIRIKVVVINGCDPANIEYAIKGKKIGTTIT